jgi:hypothetical protein
MPPDPDIKTPDPADAVASRDTLWLRWAKFASIIIVAAVLLGGLFSISIHVVALYSAAQNTVNDPYSHHIGGAAGQDIERSSADTPYAFKIRFLIGAGLGGLIGLGYVIRCLVKDEDP